MLPTLSNLLAPVRGIIQRAPLTPAWRALLSTQTAQAAGDLSAANAASSTPAPAPAAATSSEQPDQLFSKLEIELKGNDPAVLKSYAFFATSAAQHLNIEVGKSWALRKAQHDRFVLLKSVHIYKKHRVHYEIRTYFRFMHFHKLTGSTLATYLEYIERNLPEGVAMKATRLERLAVPEHLRQPPAAPEL